MQSRAKRPRHASAQASAKSQPGPLTPGLKLGGYPMSLGTILLIILVVLLIGALPTWPHSSGWGYYPTGGLGTILVIVLILVLLGRL
jgi:hypothetical protein